MPRPARTEGLYSADPHKLVFQRRRTVKHCLTWDNVRDTCLCACHVLGLVVFNRFYRGKSRSVEDEDIDIKGEAKDRMSSVSFVEGDNKSPASCERGYAPVTGYWKGLGGSHFCSSILMS